jgi:UDP-N-acetylmuramoylalanine--D-glutamate ligase
MRLSELEGKRIALWGAGREAKAAWRVLRARYPSQPLVFIVREQDLAELGQLGDYDSFVIRDQVQVDDLIHYDVVVKSPGISPYQKSVIEASARGVQWTSGTAIWFAEHPHARVIAVTGTKGKSTTSALIAHVLRSAGYRVALCGNIGMPLLELHQPEVSPDWWVAELSSFQTFDMHAVPEIALVLNLFPEHLDWHGSVETYYRDKLRLLHYAEKTPRVTILNADQTYPEALPSTNTLYFSSPMGFHVRDDMLWRGDSPLLPLAQIPLPGTHNAVNVCAALTAVEAAGVDVFPFVACLTQFKALPHRLQSLGFRDGLEFVNDSIATTPHATMAALEHFKGRKLTLLVGGYDRGVEWHSFAQYVELNPPHSIITLGQNGLRIAEALKTVSTDLHHVSGLAEAMRVALERTPLGGVVLMSPGAPSFGAFRDYIDRGQQFAALAGFDPDVITYIEGLGL